MDRRSPLVAAIAAMALLVLGSPAAHAEGELAAADSTATITTDAPSTVTTTLGDAEATQDVLQDGAPAGGAPEVSAPPPTPAADPIPAADTEAVTPSPTPAAEPEVAAPPDAAAPPAPPAQPEAPTPAEAEALAPRHATPAGGSTDARPESGSVVSNPVAASAPRQAGIEQILPAVQRDLRGIQEDVEAISRQLAMGAAPPARSLNRLRSRLEALAPVLVALDARSGLGVPSLETRQLLDRVRAQLAETQVSTAGLIAALRRSDLEGPAVRALLSELERFGALGSSFDLGPGAAPFAPTLTPVDPAVYAPVVPAVASGDAPRKRGVTAPTAGDAPEPAGQHAPAPWPSPSESSIASPGGAVSVAGAAALAALLLAFFLPRLLTRLELAPGRSHYVASVLALERPG